MVALKSKLNLKVLKRSVKISNKVNKNKNKNSVKKYKKCYKVINPYHEALIFEYIGKNKSVKPIKKLKEKWNEFSNKIKKEGYTCIKFYEELVKKNATKMIEYKL